MKLKTWPLGKAINDYSKKMTGALTNKKAPTFTSGSIGAKSIVPPNTKPQTFMQFPSQNFTTK